MTPQLMLHLQAVALVCEFPWIFGPRQLTGCVFDRNPALFTDEGRR